MMFDFRMQGDVLERYVGAGGDVTVPETVREIGYGAFAECAALTSVTIPQGVTAIRAHAFHACTSLRHVSLPARVTFIGEGAFAYCTSLAEITIPCGALSYLGADAFACCDALAKVHITGPANWRLTDPTDDFAAPFPEGVTSVEPDVFAGCGALRRVAIWDDNASVEWKYTDDEQIVFLAHAGVVRDAYAALGFLVAFDEYPYTERDVAYYTDYCKRVKKFVRTVCKRGGAALRSCLSRDLLPIEYYDEVLAVVSPMGDGEIDTLLQAYGERHRDALSRVRKKRK